MPIIVERPTNERMFYVEEVDSMGRTPEQIEAMDKNLIPAPKVRGKHLIYAQHIAREQKDYPKAMYRLALRKGVPAGDEVNPSYPMPFDLAQQTGYAEQGFKIINKTMNSQGHVVVRHPYQTRLVGVINKDGSVNLEATLKEEKELMAKGWVDAISKIVGLPKKDNAEEDFDPLPTAEPAKQKHAGA